MAKTKDQVARELARDHVRFEPSIVKVIRLRSSSEKAPTEPIKLLEINLNAVPFGIVPVMYGRDSKVPYPSVVVDITPTEFQALTRRQLKLPKGWRISEVLFENEEAMAEEGAGYGRR